MAKIMQKKIHSVVLAVLMVVAMVACTAGENGGEVVKATKGKFSEKSSAFSKEEKSKKNAKQPKGKSAPKEKLDDSLRIAVDQYNTVYFDEITTNRLRQYSPLKGSMRSCE